MRHEIGALTSGLAPSGIIPHRFDDALIEGAVQLLQKWRPYSSPVWVVAIPDKQPGGLVETYARRLADRLNLPFEQTIRRTGDRRPQKEMENSYMQATNAIHAFTSLHSRSGPVLLIDDVVDSGWTMTVVADLLRANGAAKVFPLALATAGGA